jgi:hypothetical protein
MPFGLLDSSNSFMLLPRFAPRRSAGHGRHLFAFAGGKTAIFRFA